MFRLKRAFHRSLAHVRPLIGAFGLTPARFDMMKAIRDASFPDGFIFQSWIRRALGVTAATVSRMLKSLEEIGFVVRKEYSCDKRERLVGLTEEGRRRFDAAVSELIVSGAMDLSFAGAVTSTPDWPEREEQAAQALERIDSVREAFRDVADDYLYRVTPWFCPGHPTQRDVHPRIYDQMEALDCTESALQGYLIRVQLGAIPPY